MAQREAAWSRNVLSMALRQLGEINERVIRSEALTALREGLLLLVPYLLTAAAIMLMSNLLAMWPASQPLASTFSVIYYQLVATTPLAAAAAIGYMHAIRRHLPRLASGLLCLVYGVMVQRMLPADSLALAVTQMLLMLLLPLVAIPALSALMHTNRLSLIRSDVAGGNVLDALNLIGPGIAVAVLLTGALMGLKALPWGSGVGLTPWITEDAGPLVTALAMAATNSLLWFVGVHGYHGLLPVMEHVQMAEVRHFLGVFAFIGGSGATLSLVIAMLLVCRSRRLRTLAYAGLALGCLGVNEVLLFGLPIILNPRLFLPFVLTPLCNVMLAWAVVDAGWVSMPTVSLPMTSPLGVNAYLATHGDPGAVVLQLVLIATGVALYAPFVRRYERLDVEAPTIDLPALETTYSRLQEEVELLSADPLRQSLLQRERLALRHRRMREISGYRFFVEYQPKVRLLDQRCVGAEALLRYRDADGQARSAGQFVEWLREAGLMKQLDLWVARAVGEQVQAWKRQGLRLPPISMNVTLETLSDPTSRAELMQLLDTAGGMVGVELTEEALVQDSGPLRQSIDALHRMGVQVQIDDFGTGYSALSHLHRFDVDAIKIDRSFVVATHDDKGRTVIEGVISLAQSLRLAIVVEGVETEAQLELLKGHGDIAVQGWYYSRSLSPEAFAAFAHQGRL